MGKETKEKQGDPLETFEIVQVRCDGSSVYNASIRCEKSSVSVFILNVEQVRFAGYEK